MLVVTTDFQAWGSSTVSPANRSTKSWASGKHHNLLCQRSARFDVHAKGRASVLSPGTCCSYRNTREPPLWKSTNSVSRDPIYSRAIWPSQKTRQIPTALLPLGIGPTPLGTSLPCFYFFLSFSEGQNLTEIHTYTRKRFHFWLSSPLASLHRSVPSVPQMCLWEGHAHPPRLTSKTAASPYQPHYNSTDIQNGEVQKAKPSTPLRLPRCNESCYLPGNSL